MRKFLCVLIFAGLLIGCQSGKQTAQWKGKDVTLSAEILQTDLQKIGMVAPEVAYDSTLIIKHIHCQNSYSIWKIKDDSLFYVDEFISRGEGPYEIIIPYIYADYARDRIAVFGWYNGENKVFYIHLSHPEEIADKTLWNIFHWRQKKPVSQLCPVDSTACVAMSMSSEDNMFYRFDISRDTLIPLYYPYPKTTDNKANKHLISKIFSGTLLKHPDKSRFVYSMNPWGRYSFIFDVDSSGVKNVIPLCDDIPEYGVARDGLNISYGKNSLRSYTVRVAKRHIYLMYNDFTVDDFSEDRLIDGLPMNYYNKILVYNWDGLPVKRLNLDMPILSFCVDRDENYLYAITDRIIEDNESVVRFKL